MNDTSPEAAAVQQRILASKTPGERFMLAWEWSMDLREMVRGGLRRDHPEASEERLNRLLADRWLGPELAAKAYGRAEEK